MRRQIGCFIISGCTAVATDLSIYHLLVGSWPRDISKGASFLCGTLVAYVLNKLWTFQREEHSWAEMQSFLLLYAVTLCLNISVNQVVAGYLSWFWAFFFATAASTVVNFLGQKFWVFKRQEVENE